MINLTELKQKTHAPLCEVQWVIPNGWGDSESFSLNESGWIVEGSDYQLIKAKLMPLSSDGRMIWQTTSEAIAALMLGRMGDSGAIVSELMSKSAGLTEAIETSEAEDSPDMGAIELLKAEQKTTEDALAPHRLSLLQASSDSAMEVRELQSMALERILGVPAGSAVATRTIDLGEDLFAIAWSAVSEALAAPKEKAARKSKSKAKV